MNKPTIVVIAYNRPDSLSRLLESLLHSNYLIEEVRLIISIDKSDNDNGVIAIAKSFDWPYGEKKVIIQEENLGLRKHVIKCGDLSLKYGSIVMLEDDSIVSKEYYKYACESVEYYKDNPNIAQISLFNYERNEFVSHKEFKPLKDDSDVYFMQTPSSWGQVWTSEQWKKFKLWYENEEYIGKNYSSRLPQKILDWPETSWKKYFAMYMSDNNLFAVYPYVSLSTNMADIGTHYTEQSNLNQVNLIFEFNRPFIFKELENSNCKYDCFMESILLKDIVSTDDVTINYFGYNDIEKKSKYLLSTNILPYKVKKSWDLRIKPYELNILYNLAGEGIFLYDTSVNCDKENNISIDINRIKYQGGNINKIDFINIFKYKLLKKIKRVFWKNV